MTEPNIAYINIFEKAEVKIVREVDPVHVVSIHGMVRGLGPPWGAIHGMVLGLGPTWGLTTPNNGLPSLTDSRDFN